MNTGMELMGMKECRECGDPYTPAEPDTGVCSGCTMSRELAALRAELVSHEERAIKAEARVAELERERDEARAAAARLQVRELESRLGNTEAKLESASVVEHKAVEALVTAEHERDEARNAMHRREEEVVAARCERDEARAQLADVAARQRLDTAGAACAALTDLAYGAEEAVHVRDVLMARPLVTDDARDLTGKEVES